MKFKMTHLLYSDSGTTKGTKKSTKEKPERKYKMNLSTLICTNFAGVRFLRVKSLGTITMCFPHVHEDTKDILQSAMDKAKDYGDFAEILCNRVCTEVVDPLTTYFAYYFAYNQGYFKLFDRLQVAGKHSVLAQPLLLNVNADRGMSVAWNECQKSIAVALEVAESDWIACHIYLAWRVMAERMYTESYTDSGVMRVLESKIDDDNDFSFFISYLYGIKGDRHRKERDFEEAMKMYDQAIIHAKKHDDLLSYAFLLADKANMVKRTNVEEALNLLDLQREVCETIGYAEGLGHNNLQLGHIAMAKGEFNLGIHHQNAYLQTLIHLGKNNYDAARLIAMLYNLMGDGARALELIDCNRYELNAKPISFALINEAWAMVNLRRFSDAEIILSQAKELILKSDDEVRLALTYFVEGLIEKSRNDFAAASYTFDRALSIFERYYSHAFINLTLVYLADIEIDTFSYETLNESLDFSGPMMEKLWDHVRKNNLPGIDAQSKLLKAKFLFKQGQVEQSKKLVKEVQNISKSSNMQYLEDMAKLLLPELSL